MRLDELKGLLFKNGLLCWPGVVVLDEENVLNNIEDVLFCVFIVLLRDELDDIDRVLFRLAFELFTALVLLIIPVLSFRFVVSLFMLPIRKFMSSSLRMVRRFFFFIHVMSSLSFRC
jgi:hypothetical protein